MAKIYARQIRAGKMSIDDVPNKWREAVRELLKEEEE